MRSEALRALLVAAILLVGFGSRLSAQLELPDYPRDDPAAVILAEILSSGRYQVIDRDTLLPASAVLTGHLVVLEARVTLEGRVDGAVAVVNGDFFVRTGAVVTGPIAVLGGGAFPSGLAQVGEVVYLHASRSVAVERGQGDPTILLTNPGGRGFLRLPGIFGFGIPTYQRVDGLSLFWTVGAASPGDSATAALNATPAYHTDRQRFGGEVELLLRPAYRSLLALRASRATHPISAWIRGDITNSGAALLVGSDVRDYYESDELSVTFARTAPATLPAGTGFIVPSFQVRVSRDRSLMAGDPFSLLNADEPWRENPPIDEGVLASVVLGASGGWRGMTSTLSAATDLEWAPGGVGDFEFARLRATVDWQMLALYRHRIELSGYLAFPLTGDEAPLQRWDLLGGPGTLPTFETAEMRGDHAFLISSDYLIPVTRVNLPVVGVPTLRLTHAFGSAWRSGADMPLFDQNVGLGLQLLFLDAAVYVDPAAASLEPSISFGVELPLGSRGRF